MRDGELRLEPVAGTIDLNSDVRAIRVYTSSLKHAVTGEPLTTIVSGGRGIRLTIAQCRELRDWLEANVL